MLNSINAGACHRTANYCPATKQAHRAEENALAETLDSTAKEYVSENEENKVEYTDTGLSISMETKLNRRAEENALDRALTLKEWTDADFVDIRIGCALSRMAQGKSFEEAMAIAGNLEIGLLYSEINGAFISYENGFKNLVNGYNEYYE
jgi:hypothetical protein